MTSQPQDAPDPFGDESAPAISFKNAPIGTTFTGVVTGVPKMVQSRDYNTKEPATWPDGNKKMAVVVNIEINGEPYSIWAAKPSSMYAAIGAAQVEASKVAGTPTRIQIGGTLSVRLIGEKPTNADPQKLYAAKYDPPVAGANEPDPWAVQQTAAPAAQPAAAAPVSSFGPPAGAAAPWDSAPSAQPQSDVAPW